MKTKAKVGLIIDDYVVSSQLKDLVELSKQSDIYDIDCLIIQKTAESKKSLKERISLFVNRQGVKAFLELVSFTFLQKLEKQIIKRSSKFKDFYNKYDLKSYQIDSIIVEPIVSKSGLVYRYSDQDLDKIKARKLDLLIRGGKGILKGDILNICDKGIISFHHANNDVNRGGPPGFWEVLQREKTTGFVIQLLKDELDGGDVIFKGSIATNFMYSLNLAKLYIKSNVYLHRVIERLFQGNGSTLSVYPKKPYAFKLYKTPSFYYQLSYVLKTSGYAVKLVYFKLFSKDLRWGVSYQFCDDWRDVTLRKSKIITNPPKHFLADPFVIEREGQHYCYMEDYDYDLGRGYISVYRIGPDGYEDLGIALKEDFHLSYPFLLEQAGELYMCPETHEANEIRLYRCIDFPLQWELHKVLMRGVSAADTNLFEQQGKWWLFTNICSAGINDHCSELHAFYADELLSDQWIPHALNPLMFDAEQARNGGQIVAGGNIFRVFQVQGWDLYGAALGVAKITKLSMDEYEESVDFMVEPGFYEDIIGTHTYNYSKGLVVIDHVKRENYLI